MHATPAIENAGRGGVSTLRRYVSERELSIYSGISVKTLQRWRLQQNVGPPWKRLASDPQRNERGAIRYDLAAFDQWVTRCPGGGQ